MSIRLQRYEEKMKEEKNDWRKSEKRGVSGNK
jgi:hypothetical protein